MAVADGIEDAIELRRWRRDAGITRPAAAADLGISERMLAYYEAGGHRVPRAILLAARALKAGLENAPGGGGDARERWVVLVRNVVGYGRGEPVVGRMLRERDRRGIADFLAFVKRGPDPALALTDPALFRTLRSAVTAAQLAGLARYRLDHRHQPRAGDNPGVVRVERESGPLGTVPTAGSEIQSIANAAVPWG